MKTNLPLRSLCFLLVFALATGASLTVSAGDAKAGKKSAEAKQEKQEKRAPLKISIDRKPLNRDAADRVSYAPIVKKTAASVVYVYSSKKVRAQDIHPFFNDPMFRRFFELPGGEGGGDGSSRRGGSRIPEQTQQGLGSGVVITADGYVLTNNHVVEGADDVKVSIGESNRRYDAKVVGRDSLADIAVLKIEASGLVPATFGDSDQLEIGDVVLAIGNPFGVGQSVSRGIVSALGRGGIAGPFEDFIQTDAAINPGNSGGALLDTEGRVIGINTAILSRSGGFNGVGFAIPINLARSIAEQIVNTGRVERGFLGVVSQELTEELTTQFNAERGVLVAEVTSDSPAEKAGLKPGDVITKVDGTEIRDPRHLALTVSQMAPDKQVTIDYVRDGKPQTATAKLALRSKAIDGVIDQSPSQGGEDVGVLNGVGVGDITPEIRRQLNIPSNIRGALITSVEPDSPSYRDGLREGDVILDLDKREVTNADEAVKLSEEIEGPKVLVRIWRQGRGTTFVVVDETKK